MKTIRLVIVLVLMTTLLLAACSSAPRVGELQTGSRSVALGDTEPVRVEIVMGAGNLEVSGGADKLLEADFIYNVAKLKPEMEYTAGTLVLSQPEANGLPALQGITDFRNEWDLRLYNDVPMNLSVNMGAGNSDLQLAGLSLTGLKVTLGAGTSTLNLGGDWVRDVDITMDTGAADITVIVPGDIGVRIEVDAGASMINAPDLTKDGNVYTNDAYGVSDVTLHIDVQAGIGHIRLEVAE